MLIYWFKMIQLVRFWALTSLNPRLVHPTAYVVSPLGYLIGISILAWPKCTSRFSPPPTCYSSIRENGATIQFIQLLGQSLAVILDFFLCSHIPFPVSSISTVYSKLNHFLLSSPQSKPVIFHLKDHPRFFSGLPAPQLPLPASCLHGPFAHKLYHVIPMLKALKMTSYQTRNKIQSPCQALGSPAQQGSGLSCSISYCSFPLSLCFRHMGRHSQTHQVQSRVRAFGHAIASGTNLSPSHSSCLHGLPPCFIQVSGQMSPRQRGLPPSAEMKHVVSSPAYLFSISLNTSRNIRYLHICEAFLSHPLRQSPKGLCFIWTLRTRAVTQKVLNKY